MSYLQSRNADLATVVPCCCCHPESKLLQLGLMDSKGIDGVSPVAGRYHHNGTIVAECAAMIAVGEHVLGLID